MEDNFIKFKHINQISIFNFGSVIKEIKMIDECYTKLINEYNTETDKDRKKLIAENLMKLRTIIKSKIKAIDLFAEYNFKKPIYTKFFEGKAILERLLNLNLKGGGTNMVDINLAAFNNKKYKTYVEKDDEDPYYNKYDSPKIIENIKNMLYKPQNIKKQYSQMTSLSTTKNRSEIINKKNDDLNNIPEQYNDSVTQSNKELNFNKNEQINSNTYDYEISNKSKEETKKFKPELYSLCHNKDGDEIVSNNLQEKKNNNLSNDESTPKTKNENTFIYNKYKQDSSFKKTSLLNSNLSDNINRDNNFIPEDYDNKDNKYIFNENNKNNESKIDGNSKLNIKIPENYIQTKDNYFKDNSAFILQLNYEFYQKLLREKCVNQFSISSQNSINDMNI